MNRIHRRNIIKSYILGRETESFVADSIGEINRLSLLNDAESETGEATDPAASAEDNN